ncbi:MAG: hypothetical protein ACR2HX_00550 [Pyrinomonadaceae bacterium]
MKTASLTLSDLVTVASRFGRSVNLERDFYEQAPLGGYVLTTTARAALDRLAQAQAETSGSRAWTLTGPYGSGKSAFALFAAKTLSANLSDDVQIARNLIKDQDRPLWQKLFDRRRKDALGNEGLCPVIVSGTREPLNRAILRGLETAIEQFWPSSPPLFLPEVRALIEAIDAGELVTGRQVVEKFEQMADKVGSSRKSGVGLLVVIDELGKLLEYAAVHPTESDIFLLQELAEATKRDEHPIFLITVLHQAFDRYVERLARSQREEWVKVQGRFEDIAFQEPTDQVLRIIAEAIHHEGSSPHLQSLTDHGRILAAKALKLGLVSSGGKKEDVLNTLTRCMPLHPTVSLVLGPLFRRIGQNERSLFAFLSSREPCGFNDFISTTEWKNKYPELLRLDSLYDYIITALGSALFAQSDGKKWAEIESALNRSRDAQELEIRLIKTIGVLRIIGDIGSLTSSQALLEFACDDGKTKPSEITEALNQLQQRSVIVFRRYNNAFSLWEGSDVDIEAKLKEARSHIDPNESLPDSLTRHFKPRPIVARRHSLETGTLRFFGVRYIDITSFESALTEPLGDTDGLLLYAIALTAEELRELAKRAADPRMADYPQVTIAIPQETGGLRDAIFEVACLTWVRDKTPELEGDRTARNELHARLANAEASVERLLQSSFRSNAVRSARSGNTCEWYRNGVRIEVNSERALQEYISEICDKVFHSAPVLCNELINRRHLSSSAASARRELIVAMLQNGDRDRLGIEGYPPHASMFFSLLLETGMHREEHGRWGFFPPKPDAGAGVKLVWAAIDNFLAETEVARKSVEDLFNLLGQPPFGMKGGPLPVLLCAALLHYDTEIALYEQGSFVPSLSTAVFERLVKSPGRFQVQRCRVAGVRATIFQRFASVILQKPDNFFGEKMNVLSIVRPLTRFASNLPAYTKNTQRLSKTAIQIRGAIFEAREPDRLLFFQLPTACGLQPFVADESREGAEVDLFFKRLRGSLAELQRAYDDLLSELEGLLVAAFSLKGSGAEARRELRERAQPLLDLTVEPKLKSFIIRAIDDGLDSVGWLEAVATFLATKPPASWYDNDLARFEVSLAEVARSFSHIELLSFELRRPVSDVSHSDNELMRIGVTTLNRPELERVVLVTHADRSLVDSAAKSVEDALTALGIGENETERRLSVLAKLFRKMLKELDGIEATKAASTLVPQRRRAKA